MWTGSQADRGAPLISLVGKGVCFDTGGYDLKLSGSMLRMKKDHGRGGDRPWARAPDRAGRPAGTPGGQAGLRGEQCLGQRHAPSDVLRSRRGLTVSVRNTDAEGRLVLADLLAEASDAQPAILLYFATLTGAARVALGTDLPAMFCNDDVLAEQMLHAGAGIARPVWRLPLHDSYNYLLDSNDGDLNNVSDKPVAGAIIAGLFLQRFIASGQRWIHLDVYAWNDGSRMGRPEGGEAQTLRAAYATDWPAGP